VDQAIQGVQKNTKVQLIRHQPNSKGVWEITAKKKNIWEQIFRRKIYKTPCKLMLVFRRNSVMAFKCWIIKSSLILNKPDFFS